MNYRIAKAQLVQISMTDGAHLHGLASTSKAELAEINSHEFIILRGGGTMVVCEVAAGIRPFISYCGTDLHGAAAGELSLLSTRQHAPGGAAVHLRGSMLNELGTGISGPAGLVAHREGRNWAIDLRVVTTDHNGPAQLTLHCADPNTGVKARHLLSIDTETGVFTASTEITNAGDAPLTLDWCTALSLPFDDRFAKLLGFSGRWASEFQIEEIDNFTGGYVRENKTGRTSHDCFPGLYAGTETTSENSGYAAAFHLAWSGNSRTRVDRAQDGSAALQMGELLFPGEIDLEVGKTYRTPEMKACWSKDGYSAVSRKLHDHLQDALLDKRIFDQPRPVHYNTWEAVYFDHSEARLLDLADKAAEVGAERFVLDDGWFGGRRHDKAGLGDWWVSKDVYPEGLHTLVARVNELNMQFGLWFEPEMVNPDSDLYRAHPDWVLEAQGVETIPFRNQYTLDLTKTEVFDYLFSHISALVSEYDIAYIKWDMNRDTNYPGSGGRGAMHRQTHAVYKLIADLRGRHPDLEIESCASGGGRADYGVLRHTDRFWTSDNNDARHRHTIQKGASYFFPLRVTGSHVGPHKCHITGRTFSMEFRAASAIFGHMGMELDLAEETPEDRATLARAIALHKKHRQLIHDGELYRLDTPDYRIGMGVVARDKSEALFSSAQLDLHPTTLPARFRFDGLDQTANYRVQLIWPGRNISISSPSIMEAADLLGDGKVFSASALTEYGIQLPLVMPDTCLIYHLVKES